nr:hypothetical protein [uncultured Roseateles sp.]
MSEPQAPASSLGRWALSIVWPAFLMAGVLEMLVFACVDPADLHWFGGASMELSHQAIYSLAFFVFWIVISVAGALTALLMTTPAGESPNAVAKRWPY